MNWKILIRQFQNYLRLERGLSPNSVEAYVRDVIKLRQFLEISNSTQSAFDLKLSDLNKFVNYLGELHASEYSQARIVSGIKAFFRYLMEERLIQDDPTELLEPPKIGRKLPDTLAYEEVDAILKGIDLSTPEGTRNRAMIEVLYSSGLRVSELINLHLSHVYFDLGFLKVLGKGNKERLVPIGREALKFVKTYVEHDRANLNIKKGHEHIVFLNRRGAQLTRAMIFTIVKNAAAFVDISKNVSPHTFRHSFATHLIEGGANLRAVQEMLGHESILTTEIYTHLDRDFLRQTLTEFHPRS